MTAPLSPESFLSQLPPAPTGQWQPTKAMYWYDTIIDDMLVHTGADLEIKEIAARMKRHPVTIGLIVRSDLFKARYAQRKLAFNAELQERLVTKTAQVAEKALDLSLEVMDQKRTGVPLATLTDIADKALNRLGYGVKPTNPAVVVNNTVAQVAVSAEVLAAARNDLHRMEEMRGRESAVIDVTPSVVVGDSQEAPRAAESGPEV